MLVLGSIAVFILFWILKVLLVSFLLLIPERLMCRTKCYDSMKAHLFWGGIMSTILETFIELVAASYINLRYPLFTFSGDIISFSFAIFCSVACLLTVIAAIYVLTKPTDTLQEKDFENKWSSLYGILRRNNKL